MKKVFKENDKVYNHYYGWGKIEHNEGRGREEEPIYSVIFDKNGIRYSMLQHELSFTEYTLNEFSQERPINYDEWIGKWCKFWDNNENSFIIDKLNEVRNKTRFIPNQYGTFMNCKPLTEEQVKILAL